MNACLIRCEIDDRVSFPSKSLYILFLIMWTNKKIILHRGLSQIASSFYEIKAQINILHLKSFNSPLGN